MTKILVLNPPSSSRGYINRDQMGGMGQKISFGTSFKVRILRKLKSAYIRQPVMQLVYAASILSEKNEVRVIDAMNEGIAEEEVIEISRKFKPEYVIMAVSSSDIVYEREDIAEKIKEVTGAKIITVGDAISNELKLFKNPFDIGIIGEVEPVILRIVGGEKLKNIPGIVYTKNNKLEINKNKDFLKGNQLDSLGLPKWNLFPYTKYRYYPLLSTEPAVSMLSSRGCPYGCYYCSYSKNEGTTLRMRSAENVVEEIKNNVERYGINAIVFRDPLFTGSRQRTLKICELITRKKIRVAWACETRPELLDEKLLFAMKKAGCKAINMGIESTNEQELAMAGRQRISPLNLKKILKLCQKNKIRTTCFFILGLPGATKESLADTLRFSLSDGINHSEYKIATPYPGTKLREMAIENKWIEAGEKGELSGYNSTMQISPDLSKEYLNELCDSAFKKFYYRPQWIINEIRMGNFLDKTKILLKSLIWAIK